MTNKCIVLITGASSGFGKDVAKRLINDRYTVYATARRVEMMDDLQQMGAHVFQLDVTKTDQVMDVVNKIISKEGKIDVLFNNAGFGSYSTIEALPLEDIEYQYNVNVFGVARMIKAVLPHMREKKSGLIINTSSLISNMTLPLMGWYGSSKHALKSISDTLRVELEPLGIKVVAIEPGAVKTDFDRVALNNLNKLQQPEDYRPLIDKCIKFFIKNYEKAPNSESTVNAVIQAIEAVNPCTRYRTTLDAKFFPVVLKFFTDRMKDRLLRWVI